jgi:hypothetical protein
VENHKPSEIHTFYHLSLVIVDVDIRPCTMEESLKRCFAKIKQTNCLAIIMFLLTTKAGGRRR